MSRRKKSKNSAPVSKRTVQLVTDKDKPFGYVEAYKSIRTNLKFITAASEINSFVLTSALSMESKSNTSINLAATLAEEDKKVILVDCDLRKPAIHRMLKINNHGVGLTNFLSGEMGINKVLVHYEPLNIDILPVGAIPPNPTELLSQQKMRNLLEVLKKHYDYVIVDAPPVSVVTDAAILGGMVDGALLVVRSDYAPLEMVQLAKKKLEDVNVHILGVIMSRFDAKKAGKQSGYYYSYNSYYSFGGYGEQEQK